MTNYKPKIGQSRRNVHVLLLETYSPSKLNHKDTDNLKRLINKSEIESVIKREKLPTNKSPGPYAFTEEFYWTYKEELIPILKLFQKTKEKKTLSNNSLQSYYHCEAKIRQKYHQKRKVQANIFDGYRCKTSQWNFGKTNSTVHTKRSYTMTKWNSS